MRAEHPLKTARGACDLSQSALARESNVDRRTIVRIESDARCRVYAADLIALGEVLGAAPLSLVNEGQMVVSEDRDELAAITADRDAHCACDFNPQEIANWIKQDPSRIDLLNELVVTA